MTIFAGTYVSYFLSGGHWIFILLCILLNVVSEALYTGSNIFFGIWANLEENSALTSNGSTSESDVANPLTAGLNRTIVNDGGAEDAQVGVQIPPWGVNI